MSLTNEIIELLDSGLRAELKLRLVRVLVENSPDLEPDIPTAVPDRVVAPLYDKGSMSVVPTRVLRELQDLYKKTVQISPQEVIDDIDQLIKSEARLIDRL